jgi:hypothetical protein
MKTIRSEDRFLAIGLRDPWADLLSGGGFSPNMRRPLGAGSLTAVKIKANLDKRIRSTRGGPLFPAGGSTPTVTLVFSERKRYSLSAGDT